VKRVKYHLTVVIIFTYTFPLVKHFFRVHLRKILYRAYAPVSTTDTRVSERGQPQAPLPNGSRYENRWQIRHPIAPLRSHRPARLGPRFPGETGVRDHPVTIRSSYLREFSIFTKLRFCVKLYLTYFLQSKDGSTDVSSQKTERLLNFVLHQGLDRTLGS